MQHLLNDPQFEKQMIDIAREQGTSIMKLREEAEIYFKELNSEQNEVATAVSLQVAQYALARGYEDTIDVNPVEIKALAKTMRSHPVAFVMTHKTYIDMLVLASVLARYGLPVPHIFAGINMAFMGVGELGRKTGTIFIRRDIKDNALYKACLRHFIADRIASKAHFMWAIEGTRSRTGKLVWPKMGILKYIAEGEQQTKADVKYVPVSVVYDLIPDVKTMTKEGRGLDKSPESLMWFVNYLRKMGGKFGKISLRFGEPVHMDDTSSAELPLIQETSPSDKYKLPRFAFNLVHQINQITPVTTTSLICITLLSKFAATKLTIERDVIELMEIIESRSTDALIDRGTSINESVQRALNLLIKADLIRQTGKEHKAKYAIVAENYLPATYYANMAVHHLYHRAFIEIALIKVSGLRAPNRYAAFWKEIMELRDMFKFEFFYSQKAEFSDEIEHDLSLLNKDWRAKLSGRKNDVLGLLKSRDLLLSQVVLFPYIEAYRVVGKAMMDYDVHEDLTDAQLLNECLFLGEEMHWQGQIQRLDSVSKPFLTNGIRLVKNLDLVPNVHDNKEVAIRGFIDQLEELSDLMRSLQKIIINTKAKDQSLIPLERNVVPGSKTASVTAAVVEGEDGPHIGAFFDLDRTLIKGFSAKEFFQTRLLSGRMKSKEVVAQFAGVMVYATGNRNFAGLAALSAQGVKGVPEQTFIDLGEEVYLKHLADAIYPESRALVQAHLAKGHTVAIISAATPYQVNPVARDLDIEHIMCTRMKVEKGKFTGEIIEPACWGEGKSHAAIELAKEHKLDMAKSYFYTDSHEDLPLMEIVGHPRPINPDKELRAIAYQNNWPVMRFDDEQASGMKPIAQTALAFGSIIPAVAGGVLSGLSSGSWQQGTNSTIALVGDLACAVAGIKLVIKGKEHLSSRPAVVLFNHQSYADFFIMAKIFRKDLSAVAKKELQLSPIGPLFKAAGVIFVDRMNKEKALEAMKPGVTALQNGTSIAIAPEGTRSKDYTLGPFKKGAWHLAMQAGVPILPVVIMNAYDAMPKGAAILKPAVIEVRILPPVSTEGWKKRDLDKSVIAVRNQYLAELGQTEQVVS